MTRLIYGVGVNDSSYNVYRYEHVNGKLKILWTCPYYRAWKNMLERCYSKKWHQSRPTYSTCHVCDEWKTFSAFKIWMEGKEWRGKHLDKDILIPGSKIYSPETCAFITGELNGFILAKDASRGRFPIGVSWHKRSNKFRASCRNPFNGKSECLGDFF